MRDIDVSNASSPSTNWEFRKVKVKRAALPPKEQTAAGRRTPPLTRRNRRKPLTIRVCYRGGCELDWTIEARGQRWSFDGFTAIEDVMATILKELPRPRARGSVIEITGEGMFGIAQDVS